MSTNYARYSGIAGSGGGGGGSGTVTSVGLVDGSSTPIYTITGSPVTTSGNLTFTLNTELANVVFSGPTTGSAAQPTFRALVANDLPSAYRTVGNLTDAGTDGITITSGTGAVLGSGTSISQHVADTTHNGYLSSTDWNTFNNKQSTITTGNLTDVGTDGITITGGTGAVIGSGTSISQHVADTTHNGYLSSTDWNTFNNKQASGNYITALTGDVTATGPGSVAATLATVNLNTGPFGSTSSIPTFTVNGKGLITAASGNASTATPTASIFAGWDANKNLSAVNMISGYSTTVTAAGTTTLTVGSNAFQYFTGSTTQTVVLPVATTLVNGQSFTIVNLSSGVVTVQTSGGNTIQAVASTSKLFVTCSNTSGGTGIASWTWDYSVANTGVVPITLGGTGQTTAPTARASSGLNIDQMTSIADANYTILSTDRAVAMSSITAARTWTLPAANSFNVGQLLRLQDESGSATTTNTITINRAGSDTINGATSIQITTAYGGYVLISDGSSKWYFQQPATGVVLSDWANNLTFTPNNFGTVSSSSFYYKRVGDTMYVNAYFVTGTVVASTASITLPINIDTTKLPAQTVMLGIYNSFLTGSNQLYSTAQSAGTIFFDSSTNNQIFLSGLTGTTSYTKQNAAGVTANNTAVSIQFSYPVSGWASTGQAVLAPIYGYTALTAGSTYTTPSNITATTTFKITCVGGGGAGGGSSSTVNARGTGGGAAALGTIALTGLSPSTGYSYSVGSGGTGVSNGTGNSGGNTTITINGTTYTAGGGTGGPANATQSGGAGGATTNFTGASAISIAGQQGGATGTALSTGVSAPFGGSVPGYGAGGANSPPAGSGGTTGLAGTGYGAGGGGGTTASASGAVTTGGAGVGGVIIIEYFG